MSHAATHARTFLELHQAPELLTVVNVWDAITAKVVSDTPGTKALATASHSIAATLGYPDGEKRLFGRLRGCILSRLRGRTPSCRRFWAV